MLFRRAADYPVRRQARRRQFADYRQTIRLETMMATATAALFVPLCSAVPVSAAAEAALFSRCIALRLTGVMPKECEAGRALNSASGWSCMTAERQNLALRTVGRAGLRPHSCRADCLIRSETVRRETMPLTR